jgi:hypothetical protein
VHGHDLVVAADLVVDVDDHTRERGGCLANQAGRSSRC